MVVVVPIAAIIIAIFAVLAYFALRQIIETMVQVLPNWSLPGLGSLRGAVSGAFASVNGFVVSRFMSSIHALTSWVGAPIKVFTNLIDSILSVGRSIYNTLNYITAYAIPHAISGFAAHVATLINEVRAYAVSVAHDLHLAIDNEIAAVRAILAAAIAAALAEAISTAQHLYNLAHQEIGALYNLLHAELLNGLNSMLHQVKALIGIAITDLEQEAAHAVSAVIPKVRADVAGVIDAAGDGFTDVTDLLKDLDWLKIGTLAGSAAGALSIAGALAKLAEDCTIPNCKNLSGFGRDLQGLLGLVADGALLAFLAEAAHNPAGTATYVDETIGGAYRTAAGLFGDLVGV